MDHINILTLSSVIKQNYFVKQHSDYAHKYSAVDIEKMFEF